MYQVAPNPIRLDEMKFKNVNKVKLIGEIMELKDLETLLVQYPNLEVLMIKPLINGELENSSKVVQVSNVHLWNGRQFGLSLLTKFTGRNISLYETVLVEEELNEIIRKWIKSEAFLNLETVFAVMESQRKTGVDTDVVFHGLPVEVFNPTNRQEHFQLDGKVFGHSIRPFRFSGDGCYDVIRERDGKRASIFARYVVFNFVVWN